MKSIALLVALSSPALAQTVDWSNGACYSNGIYFPARPSGQCVDADKGAFAQTAPPLNLLGVTTVTVPALTATTGAISTAPNCPSDRTVVMLDTGTYKCAKDLTDPK
jgi:hypothetical protein